MFTVFVHGIDDNVWALSHAFHLGNQRCREHRGTQQTGPFAFLGASGRVEANESCS